MAALLVVVHCPIFFWGGEQGTLGGCPRAYAPGGPGGENDSATAMDLNGED